MLMIRLQRVGKKHDPSFRVVLTDKRNSTKSGKYLEILGNYNARRGEPVFEKERIAHWIEKGAQPTQVLHNLFVDAKIIEGKKVRVTKLPKKEAVAAAPTPESTAPATA